MDGPGEDYASTYQAGGRKQGGELWLPAPQERIKSHKAVALSVPFTNSATSHPKLACSNADDLMIMITYYKEVQ
jgi:hypothetical protein